jgi:hypothetical protein
LVLAAGVAQAEVTFSGKAEAGISRTSKVDAVAETLGKKAIVNTGTGTNVTSAASANGTAVTHYFLNGALASVAATTSTDAVAADVANAKADLATAKRVLAGAENDLALAATVTAYNAAATAVANAKMSLAIAEAVLDTVVGTSAVAAKAAGDMVAYSGYDMNVAVSSTLDNGMELSAAFDMGAGNIADRDDDRVLDAQAAAVALSTVTIKNGGVTYVIGNDEIDDLYSDNQNGDVSVSGAMGGISYTLVADLDKDTKAAAAKYTAASSTASNGRAITTDAVYDAAGAAITTTSATTRATGDSDYVAATYTDAVAAVHESTSLKLSGAVAGATWSFTTTNKDDFGDAASLITLGYAAGDALSFTLKHDTDGAAEAINTLSATYTMDAITLTVSASDDKDHARNTNTGKKASQNMTIAYANGPLAASFNNDESSAWWATTSYDLGNGADIFATVDHTEFAVVGLSFNF